MELILNKKEGETPLECLGRFRKKNPKYKNLKMTYAGRLDPMASGLLLVLVGEEVKNKEKYLKLSKEYEFEVLFGFATDTYDILGKVEHSHILKNVRMLSERELTKNIKHNLKNFTGKFKQKYPMYSSKTVEGKALWTYAREVEAVDAPMREVEVKSLKFIKLRKIKNKKLLENIEKRVGKVKGDFRQKEILKIWRKNLYVKDRMFDILNIASFKINCSSGTYVRGIAQALGEHLGVPTLAFSIKRTKLGKWGKIK